MSVLRPFHGFSHERIFVEQTEAKARVFMARLGLGWPTLRPIRHCGRQLRGQDVMLQHTA